MPLEPRTDRLHFLRRLALMQKGITKPMPVLAPHVLPQQRFVLDDFRFELLGGQIVEIEMRPAVIAERLPGVAPRFEHRDGVGVRCLRAVDEAVGGRHAFGLKRRQYRSRYLQARLARRKCVVHREIIEGDGHLLRAGGGRPEQRDRHGPLGAAVHYSTVKLLARLRGWSTSVPLNTATW